MKKPFFFSVFATLALALVPSLALANLYCPVHSSIFGTVQRTHPTEITLKSVPSEFGRLGYIHVTISGTHVNANGLPLRPGVFAGVYGCLEPNHRAFRAEDITLATDASAYSAYPRRTVTIQGRIDTIERGHFLLDSNQGHGDVWVYTNQTGLRKGQLVSVTGSFAPEDDSFQASSINVLQP